MVNKVLTKPSCSSLPQAKGLWQPKVAPANQIIQKDLGGGAFEQHGQKKPIAIIWVV